MVASAKAEADAILREANSKADGINGEAGAALRTAKGALSAAKSEQGSIASRVASLTSAQEAAQKKFDGTWAINIFQWE